MLTNVPVDLVRMVASVLIPLEGTNAHVSEDGTQGRTVMKVSLANEATETSNSSMIWRSYLTNMLKAGHLLSGLCF